jgi:hypothetical protein
MRAGEALGVVLLAFLCLEDGVRAWSAAVLLKRVRLLGVVG